MALTFNGKAVVTIPVIDATGSVAQIRLTFKVPNLNDIANTVTQIVGGVPAITALSGAVARNMTISLGWAENSPAQPASGSRVERIGQWLMSAGQKTATIAIPSIRNELVDGVGYIIRSSPTVQAFETFLLANSSASNSEGIEFTEVLDAREVFRASGRRAPRLRG